MVADSAAEKRVYNQGARKREDASHSRFFRSSSLSSSCRLRSAKVCQKVVIGKKKHQHGLATRGAVFGRCDEFMRKNGGANYVPTVAYSGKSKSLAAEPTVDATKPFSQAPDAVEPEFAYWRR